MFRYSLPSGQACQDFVAGSHNVVLRQQDQVFLRKPEIVSPLLVMIDCCCDTHTHTVILLRHFIFGVKQLQSATQKGNQQHLTQSWNLSMPSLPAAV